MMNAQEFAQYEQEVFQGKIRPRQATSVPVEYQNPAQYAGRGTDWYGLLLRDAPIQSYSLSSSQDKLSAAATLGYLKQEGVLSTDDNWPVYRCADALLLAECLHEEGKTAEVLIYSNSEPGVPAALGGGGVANTGVAWVSGWVLGPFAVERIRLPSGNDGRGHAPRPAAFLPTAP